MRFFLPRFCFKWMKVIAAAVLIAFLPVAAEIWSFPMAARVARAETPETAADPWGDLQDLLILEPFPKGFNATPKPEAKAEPLPFRAVTTLSLSSPVTGEVNYQQANIRFFVERFLEPTGTLAPPVTLNTKPVDVGGATYSDTWYGYPHPEGLYYWGYEYTPVEPPACTGETCPPPPTEGELQPVSKSGFPVIYDTTDPMILGLRHLKSGWLGVEVRDLVSGIASVEASIRRADQTGTGDSLPKVETAEHPRHAVVKLPIGQPAGQDLVLIVTVKDWAGNSTTEMLPLHPYLRTAQLGAGGPWPTEEALIGGEPHTVNLVTGNGMITHEEIVLPAFSQILDISRTYNHQNRAKGLLGWGWRLSIEADLKLWPSDRVTWQDPSGTEYVFDLSRGGEVRPTVDGVDRAWPRLMKSGTSYRLRWPQGERILFHQDGRVDAFGDNAGFRRIVYEYNALTDRLESIDLPGTGRSVDLKYAGEKLYGLDIQGSDGKTYPIRFDYDGRDNLRTVTGLGGRFVSFTYDDYHRLTKIKHHLKETGDNEISWVYNPLVDNRVSKLTHNRGDQDVDRSGSTVVESREITYTRDAEGEVATIEDPLGVTRFRWDHLGRPLRLARQLTATSWAVDHFTFDGHNLTSHTDPIGRKSSYLYDQNDNMISERLPDGSNSTWNYTYEADRPADFELKDRVKQVVTRSYAVRTDSSTSSEVLLNMSTDTYKIGRLEKSEGPHAPDGSGPKPTETYSYNGGGQLERVTSPTGFVTTYEYQQGQLFRVNDWPMAKGVGIVKGANAEWTEYTYDGLGAVGTATTKLFGQDQLVTAYETDYKTGDVKITYNQPKGAVYSRDTVTQVTYQESYIGARPLQVKRWYEDDPNENFVAARYRYNKSGMVIRANTPEGEAVHRYDALGNLRILVQRRTPKGSDSYDQVGEALVQFRYDPAGRVTR